MHFSAGLWLFFNLLSTAVLAFFSMAEMACVSFNKVRLQYYFSKGHTRAAWLNYLLQNPSRLFGTTLIIINLAMVIGSECSREFHSAIGINPDLAPLSQVILVVIFGELGPIFAARRYPEHVAMITVPLVYFTARIMTPLLWILSAISKASNRLFGGKKTVTNFFINQEELQKLIEEQDESSNYTNPEEDFDTLTASIFKLNEKDARQVMKPISNFVTIPSNATIFETRKLMARTKQRFIPIYFKDIHHIIGIASPRDLIRAPDNKRLRDFHRPPWFITQETKSLQILKQFKSNNQNVAIVLDTAGKTIGIISIDDIMEEIFGKAPIVKDGVVSQLIIDRSFSGDMTVLEFYKQFGIKLDENVNLTLSQIIKDKLQQVPEKGDSVYIEPFEMIVKETTLRDVKTVVISTKKT